MKYTVKDNQSGDTVTFDWTGQGEPGDSDLAEVFAAAQKVPKSMAPPPGDTAPPPQSDSFLKGGLWSGGLKPFAQALAAPVQIGMEEVQASKPQGLGENIWQALPLEARIPLRMLGGMYGAQEAEFGKANEAGDAGRTGEQVYRTMAGALPLVGPMMGHALDTALEGRPREAIGQAMIGAPLQFALGEGLGKGLGKIGEIGDVKIPESARTAADFTGGILSGKAAEALPGIGKLIKVGSKAAAEGKAQRAGKAASAAYRTLPGRSSTGLTPPPDVATGTSMNGTVPAPEGLTPPPGISSSPMELVGQVAQPDFTGRISGPALPKPPVGASSSTQYTPVNYPDFQAVTAGKVEAPVPPTTDLAPWKEFIQATRGKGKYPWTESTLHDEAINAVLDATKRGEANAAGKGYGFDPQTDSPPRWNPIVAKVSHDPVTGKTVETLPEPPQRVEFGDEAIPIDEFLKKSEGKIFESGSPDITAEGGEMLNHLNSKYGDGGTLADKAVEGEVNPVVDGNRLLMLFKQGGKITDYAVLENGILRERVRGGKVDPSLASESGMARIMDALWETRDKWKAHPNTMNDMAVKSWQRFAKSKLPKPRRGRPPKL